MSTTTTEGTEIDSPSAESTNNAGNNEETSPTGMRSGPGGDAEGGSKVVFLLKAVGGAPILKKKKWALPRSKTIGHIVEFLRKYLQLDAQQQQQIFLYVNQAFSPALDTTIGSINDCFSSEGTLVLHYALTQAWGLMFLNLLGKNFVRKSAQTVISCSMLSSSSEPLTDELVRKRLTPYFDTKPTYVDELSNLLPKLKRTRRAAVLAPLYCNQLTNRIEVLLMKRSEKMRSHTGMVAFPGGMSDPTDRDSVHTAQREAEEEIGLQPHQYSVVGCLLPITDSRLVVITPVVALLHSPKFTDFRLSPDEATDAFYVDLEQFLVASENYRMSEIGDDFVTHHFDVNQYHIWGITAYQLIMIAAMVYQRTPQFPVFRHEQYLDMKNLKQQQMDFFRFCVDYRNRNKTKGQHNEKSRL